MADTTVGLSIDEAKGIIAEVGREGNDAARLRAAFRVLEHDGSAAVRVPPPIGDPEVIDRLARLMKAYGPEIAQLAYRRAWPTLKTLLAKAIPKATEAHLNIDYKRLPRTIRQFYRMFPELKGPGYPRGYPAGKGLEIQAEWLKKQSIQILITRANARAEQPQKDLASTDALIRDEPGDNPSGTPRDGREAS